MTQSFYEYIKSIDHAVTHAGKFHADDVFSTALLHYINPDIRIERVNRVPEEYEGLAFDIGFGPYDHHQEDKAVRENGVPYAAFGLLFRELGPELLGKEEAEKFDRRFIEPLDYNDNFGEEHVIARAISNFNPCWDSEEDAYDAFLKASEWALAILKGEFAQIEGRMRAKELVEEALADAKDGIMVLKRSMPWKKYVKGTEVEFVIYPSNRGGYCAQAVPDEIDYRKLKCPFAKEWCGKTEEEIKEVSGIETATFCHNSGFLFSALTLEDCIKACELSRMQKETPVEAEKQKSEGLFLNASHVPASEWEEAKTKEAARYGKVVDFELPDVNSHIYRGISFPEEGMDQLKTQKEKKEEAFDAMVDDVVDAIVKQNPNAVFIETDAVFMHAVVTKLQQKEIPVVGARYDAKGEFHRFLRFV